jgi:hypothetical protein
LPAELLASSSAGWQTAWTGALPAGGDGRTTCLLPLDRLNPASGRDLRLSLRCAGRAWPLAADLAVMAAGHAVTVFDNLSSGTRDNLRWMTQAAQEAGAKVLLLGMQMPSNYGRQYAQDFEQLFASVAQERKAALLPFFLQGVADGKDPLALFQADRIHPNAQAQPLMLENVWPVLRPLL